MSRQKVDYLTDTQERILRLIRTAILDDGMAPTIAGIAAAVGLRDSSVHYQLRQLEQKGAIVRAPRTPRGIRLT